MNNQLLNVLYVEDNPSDIKMIRRYFEQLDQFEVQLDSVHTAEKAVNQFANKQYNLLMLDYRLPDEDGIELLKTLKQNEVECATIMLSGKGTEEIAATSIRIGAHDYLPKENLSAETLESSVELVLDVHHEEQATGNKIEELKKRSKRDELTGLYNRRSLQERLQEEINRARRYGTVLCFTLIDLDNFKQVNDNYGHVKGDELLQEAGNILRNNTREADFAARFGGDEFCVISPSTHAEDIISLAERVCEKMKMKLREMLPEVRDLSCSIGITECVVGDFSPETMIRKADKAMYSAKEKGGDCIHVFQSSRSKEIEPGQGQ